MRTIAVSNQKGGVGKTTTAVNLAAALAEQGERVLLVDLDAQASATRWLLKEPGTGELVDVFTVGKPLAAIVRPTGVPGLEVAPGSPAMGSIERAMASVIGAEHVFAEALGGAGEWDYVLVDCPPALGLASVSALVACQEVLVPVAARAMDIHGLVDLVSAVDRVRARLNPELRISAVLACQVDARTRLAADVIAALRRRFGDAVLRTAIRLDVRLAEAPAAHKPITVYAPLSRGAIAYRQAAVELRKISCPA